MRWRSTARDLPWGRCWASAEVGLTLEEIAKKNLSKTRGRWLTEPLEPLDATFPGEERLPRRGKYTFVPVISKTDRPAVELWFDDKKRGDVLTDATHEPDGYRFHDVFHLSYAVLLG